MKRQVKKDLEAFFRSVNWRDYWEEFYLTRKPDGTFLYRNIFEFARAKTKDKEQQRFIIWYCGADIFDDAEAIKKYSFVQIRQGDWREKRQSGDWYREQQARTVEALNRIQSDTFTAIKQTGNKIALPLLVMFGQLPTQILDSFGGQLTLDTLNFEQNVARTRSILGLMNTASSMFRDMFSGYAKSQGFSFEDAQASLQIVLASIQGSQTLATEENHVSLYLKKIASDTLERSANYDLPIPDEMKRTAIEVSAKSPSKKNVQ